jgi:hypothetical protein
VTTTITPSLSPEPSPTATRPFDAFIGAAVIDVLPFVLVGSTVGSTSEVGEPGGYTDGLVSGGGVAEFVLCSAWFKYVHMTTGSVNVSTLGSTFDTVLQVFVGDAVDALTQVACNDDCDGGGSAIGTDSGVTGADGSASRYFSCLGAVSHPNEEASCTYSTGFVPITGTTYYLRLTGRGSGTNAAGSYRLELSRVAVSGSPSS